MDQQEESQNAQAGFSPELDKVIQVWKEAEARGEDPRQELEAYLASQKKAGGRLRAAERKRILRETEQGVVERFMKERQE